MRCAGVLLLGLCSACVTGALWTGAKVKSRPPELRGEVECDLDLRTPPPRSGTLAFAVSTPVKSPPKRMKTEMGRGRTCLLLRSPFALSFAGSEILGGRTPFAPEVIAVHFAQTRTKEGTRRDPALLRIEGPIPEGFASRVERTDDLPARHPLDEVQSDALRQQLGHGMDVLMELAANPGPADTVSWFGVEGPGEWQKALDEARRGGSLQPLEPYRVFARVWRNGRAIAYRLRLDDVVLASQMSFGRTSYTWEGLWAAALELPDGASTASAGIPSSLQYKEYREQGKDDSGTAWRVLLTPVALAADYGVVGLDEWLDEWLYEHSDDVSRPRK